jgi:uncharacterized protein YfkK (UPF0435 family)
MPQPIIFQSDKGLNNAILGVGDAFAQAINKRGQEQQQLGEMDALQQAMSSINPEDSLVEQMSAFQSALSQSGKRVNPQTALGYMKLLGEQSKRKNQVDPVKRGQYNQNAKLIASIQGYARKAKPLLDEAENVFNAITSDKVPGAGAGGAVSRFGNWLTGKTPKEVQTLKSIAKRSLIDLGDTKGMRGLTTPKLALLEDNLFNPNKSMQENMEAFRLWYDLVKQGSLYPQAVQQILEEDPAALYDPLLEDRVSNLTEQLSANMPSPFGQKKEQSFADIVREKRKKK